MYIFGWAYMKTMIDKLTISGNYVATSQTDMVLVGFLGSPVILFSITFIGGTIVCSAIIGLTKKVLGSIGMLKNKK